MAHKLLKSAGNYALFEAEQLCLRVLPNLSRDMAPRDRAILGLLLAGPKLAWAALKTGAFLPRDIYRAVLRARYKAGNELADNTDPE